MSDSNRRRLGKYILIAIFSTIFVTVLVLFWIYPFFKNYLKNLDSTQILSFWIVSITALTLCWKIIIYIFEYQSKKRDTIKFQEAKEIREGNENSKFALYSLSLKITTNAINKVIITAKITNTGKINSTPFNVNLYIDQGVLSDDKKRYKFPYVLHHRSADGDCILSKATQKASTTYPHNEVEEEFQDRDLLKLCIPLRHLSKETIKFIAPGESFSEDVVLNIDTPGVYRAIMVFIPTNKKRIRNDCNHCFKCFGVSKNGSEYIVNTASENTIVVSEKIEVICSDF